MISINHFVTFDLRDEGDSLEIGEGGDLDNPGPLVCALSGDVLPSDCVVWTSNSWVKFASDSYGVGMGFKLEIHQVLGGELHYNLLSCKWNVNQLKSFIRLFYKLKISISLKG